MTFTSRSQFWFLTFAAYFVSQVLVRVATGGALGLDEAQIMRHGQYLSWGYGAQPPLYAWLQFLVLQVTGNSIFGLSLLKNTFLMTSVTIWFLLFRREVGVAKAGLLASAFVLIPQFSWESQRALTHSVLAGTVTSAFYYWFWTSMRTDRPATLFYGGLGLIMGAGILAKATFLLVPIATILAAISMPDLRGKLSVKGVGFSLLIATLVALPYGVWAFFNHDAAFSSAWKFEVAEEASFASAAVQGLGGLAVAVISFLILAIVVLLVLWLAFRVPAQNESSEFFSWLVRSMVCAVLLIALVVILSKTTNVKDRWLQASLMPAGALLVWYFFDRLSERGRKVLGYTLATLSLVVMAGQPFHSLVGRAYRASPFDQVALHLETEIGIERPIVAGDWVSGNLIYQDRGLLFHRPSEALNSDQQYNLVVRNNWSIEETEQALEHYRSLGFEAGPFREFGAPYRFANDELFSIKYSVLTPN